jgi:hypothetical protein
LWREKERERERENTNQLSPENFPTTALVLGSAYKLSLWTIAAKTIFQNFLRDEAKHTLQHFSQYFYMGQGYSGE